MSRTDVTIERYQAPASFKINNSFHQIVMLMYNQLGLFNLNASEGTPHQQAKPSQSRNSKEELRTYHRTSFEGRLVRTVEFSLDNFSRDVEEEQLNFKAMPSNMYEKVLREYKLQSSIKEEFVIRNLQKQASKRKVYFVQEYYQCFLEDFPVSDFCFSQRIRIFNQLAKTLKNLSQQNIVHRLLCPKTVCICLYKGEYYLKINCFQQALEMQNPKQSSKAFPIRSLHTISEYGSYLAPELRQDEPYSTKTDIWGLGTILNFLLYGTFDNVAISQRSITAVVPEGTPLWLEELLNTMLHKNPASRYEVGNVLDIIKVALKCVDVMDKYVPLGSAHLQTRKSG